MVPGTLLGKLLLYYQIFRWVENAPLDQTQYYQIVTWVKPGNLTDGEDTVLLTSLYWFAPFYFEIIIYHLYKMSYINEEVTRRTEPSPTVSILWSHT